MAIKVDLLPTERKKFGFDIVIAIVVLVIAVAGIGFFMFGENLRRVELTKWTETVNKNNDTIESLKREIPAIEELRKKNQELRAQINTVKTLRYDPLRYSNLLDEISALLPNNMWVSSIGIDPTKNLVQLTGVAVEQPGVRPLESISGFMKSLNIDRSSFISATIASTTRGTQSVGKSTYTSYSWSIDAVYDPAKAEGNASAAEAAPSGSTDSSPRGRS